MFWGIKSETGKHLAYKNCWCQNCDSQQLANQYQKKLKLTLFWVPLIPLAQQKYWECSNCLKEPKYKNSASKGLDLLLLLITVFAIIFIIAQTLDYFYQNPNNVHPLFFIVAILYVLFILKRQLNSREQVLDVGSPFQVIPICQINCIYCQGILESRPKLYCPNCQLDAVID